jgi:hypothetical protein
MRRVSATTTADESAFALSAAKGLASTTTRELCAQSLRQLSKSYGFDFAGFRSPFNK